jgi:hypothetical protein
VPSRVFQRNPHARGYESFKAMIRIRSAAEHTRFVSQLHEILANALINMYQWFLNCFMVARLNQACRKDRQLDTSTILAAGLITGLPFLGVTIGIIGKRWIDFKEKAMELRFLDQERKILELGNETEVLNRRLESLEKEIVDTEFTRLTRD